jgi:hypothetical protein
MEEKSYKLVQSWCLNPFEIVENNVLVLGHVAKMVFFEGGKVILEYGNGWFGYGNNPVKELALKGVTDCKRVTAKFSIEKAKEDTIYIEKFKGYGGAADNPLTIYIPVTALGIHFKETKTISNDTEVKTYHVWEVETDGIMKNDSEQVSRPISITFDIYQKAVLTEFGEEIEKTRKLLKSFGMEVYPYHVEKFLREYKVTKR